MRWIMVITINFPFESTLNAGEPLDNGRSFVLGMPYAHFFNYRGAKK